MAYGLNIRDKVNNVEGNDSYQSPALDSVSSGEIRYRIADLLSRKENSRLKDLENRYLDYGDINEDEYNDEYSNIEGLFSGINDDLSYLIGSLNNVRIGVDNIVLILDFIDEKIRKIRTQMQICSDLGKDEWFKNLHDIMDQFSSNEGKLKKLRKQEERDSSSYVDLFSGSIVNRLSIEKLDEIIDYIGKRMNECSGVEYKRLSEIIHNTLMPRMNYLLERSPVSVYLNLGKYGMKKLHEQASIMKPVKYKEFINFELSLVKQELEKLPTQKLEKLLEREKEREKKREKEKEKEEGMPHAEETFDMVLSSLQIERCEALFLLKEIILEFFTFPTDTFLKDFLVEFSYIKEVTCECPDDQVKIDALKLMVYGVELILLRMIKDYLDKSESNMIETSIVEEGDRSEELLIQDLLSKIEESAISEELFITSIVEEDDRLKEFSLQDFLSNTSVKSDKDMDGTSHTIQSNSRCDSEEDLYYSSEEDPLTQLSVDDIRTHELQNTSQLKQPTADFSVRDYMRSRIASAQNMDLL